MGLPPVAAAVARSGAPSSTGRAAGGGALRVRACSARVSSRSGAGAVPVRRAPGAHRRRRGAGPVAPAGAPAGVPVAGLAGLRPLRDPALPGHGRAVGQLGAEGDVLQGGGQDAAPHVEHPGGLLEGPLEGAGDLGHGGDVQVAEGVPGQVVALPVGGLGEAVLEQGRDQRIAVRQGGDALPEVARGEHAQVAPQPAGGAAVVADRDHRGQVARGALEAPQQGREPGAAADGHHPGPAAEDALRPEGLAEAEAPGVAPAVGEVGQQQADEGGHQLPGGPAHQAGPEQHQQQPAGQPGHELQGGVVDRLGEGGGAVEVGQQQRQAERHQGQGEHVDERPALDPQPRLQPAAQPRPVLRVGKR